MHSMVNFLVLNVFLPLPFSVRKCRASVCGETSFFGKKLHHQTNSVAQASLNYLLLMYYCSAAPY